jgi:hypothetical protein
MSGKMARAYDQSSRIDFEGSWRRSTDEGTHPSLLRSRLRIAEESSKHDRPKSPLSTSQENEPRNHQCDRPERPPLHSQKK